MLLQKATTSRNPILVLGVAICVHQPFPWTPEAAEEQEAKQGACSRIPLANRGGNEYPSPKQGIESESSTTQTQA